MSQDPLTVVRGWSAQCPAYERVGIPAFITCYAALAISDANFVLVVGRWNGRFVHVPMAIRERYCADTSGDLWTSVLQATGQAREFR